MNVHLFRALLRKILRYYTSAIKERQIVLFGYLFQKQNNLLMAELVGQKKTSVTIFLSKYEKLRLNLKIRHDQIQEFNLAV